MLGERRIFITVAMVLALGYIGVNVLGEHNVTRAKAEVKQKEKISREDLMKSIGNQVERFREDFPDGNFEYDRQRLMESARIQKDTVAGFWFVSSSLPYSVFDNSLAECLYLKMKKEYFNRIELERYEEFVESQIKIRGNIVRELLSRIDRSDFFSKSSPAWSCEEFFNEFSEVEFSLNAADEFKRMVDAYKFEMLGVTMLESNELQRFGNSYKQAERSFPNSGVIELQKRTSEMQFIIDEKEFFRFDGNHFNVAFSYEVKVFDETAFNYVVGVVEQKVYKTNSLLNGAAPYKDCYGASNQCAGFGCSSIRVNAPRESDVMVIIKKGGYVYRHGYVKGGMGVTFNLENGTYTPYFYYGDGWNPNKVMPSKECGSVFGGFVSGESVGKDDPQWLNNQILTYTLVKQTRGNFTERPSSVNEAF